MSASSLSKTIEFESRLAKIIIEHPELYIKTIKKINDALIKFFSDNTKRDIHYSHPEKKSYHMTNVEFLQHVYKNEPQA